MGDGVKKFTPRLTRQLAPPGSEVFAGKVDENLLALRDISASASTSIQNLTEVVNNLPGTGPWLAPTQIYVSPLGNDANSGLGWDTAVKTGYVGYKKIIAAGGGILRVAAGAAWGGVVFGQGCWLRGDGLDVPGWLAQVPCIIEFGGPGSSFNPFQNVGSGVLYGGSNAPSDFRQKPAIWIAGSNVPITIRNIQTAPTPGLTDSEQGNYYAFRVGWDYPRQADGSRLTQAISSSTRTSTGSGATANGTTVHTVALAPALQIALATRKSNVTAVTVFKTTAVAAPPYQIGTRVYLSYTDSNFTSGAYVITGLTHAGAGAIGTNWEFTVADVAPDHTSFANPGTVSSLVVTDGDLIDLESSDANLPSTQYLVSATSIVNATTGTVSVVDPFGGWGGIPNNYTASNIGVLVQQERGWSSALGVRLENCASYAGSAAIGHQVLRTGPMFDYGGGVAFGPIMDSCYMEGYSPGADTTIPYDPYRMSALLDRCSAGVPGCSSTITVEHCRGANASMRITADPQATALVILDDILFDGAGHNPPSYVIDGGDSSFVRINDVFSSDALPGWGDDLNSITGIPGIQIEGNCASGYTAGRLGGVQGAVGPASNGLAYPNKISPWQEGISPWVNPTVGTWGYKDWMITGRHPAAWRRISPAEARFHNMIGPPSTWTGGAFTTGFPGPGEPATGTSATRITAGPVNLFPLATDTVNTWAQGGYFCIAGWINSDGVDPAYLFNFGGSGTATWRSTGNTSWLKQVPFIGPGWHFVVGYDKVINTPLPAQAYTLSISAPTGTHTDVFGMTAFYAPPTIAENDICEYLGTLRAQPHYLLPGMVGTFEGQPFHADGGIGVDVSVLTTPSGVAVQAGNLPILKRDGTVQAYVPTMAGNTALNTTGDHKVIVNGSDTSPDYLAAKVTSSSGNIVATTLGGSRLNLNSIATTTVLPYMVQLGTGSFPTDGYCYTSMTNIASSPGAGDGEYDTGIVATTVRLGINVSTNSLSGGAGTWTLTVYRNGVATAATITLSSGTTGKQSISVAIAGGAATDTYGLAFDSLGMTPLGSSIQFTASVLVSGTA